MITTLIAIQTVCVTASTIYVANKLSTNKNVKLKLHKKYSNGFKHYTVGGK